MLNTQNIKYKSCQTSSTLFVLEDCKHFNWLYFSKNTHHELVIHRIFLSPVGHYNRFYETKSDLLSFLQFDDNFLYQICYGKMKWILYPWIVQFNYFGVWVSFIDMVFWRKNKLEQVIGKGDNIQTKRRDFF